MGACVKLDMDKYTAALKSKFDPGRYNYGHYGFINFVVYDTYKCMPGTFT